MLHVHNIGTTAFAGASRKHEPVTPLDNARTSFNEWKALIDRMGSLWRNHPFVVRALRLFGRHIIGNPIPLFRGNTEDAATFLEWYDDAGWGRHHGSYGQIQNIMAHHLLNDGEVFVQFLTTMDSSHSNGLLLNLIPMHALDTSRGDYGHEIKDGRWLGAYFRDTRITVRPIHGTRFVPSTELVWLRNLQLTNQIRAVPWNHSGMEASTQLHKAMNTLVYQLRIAASMMPILLTNQPFQDMDLGDQAVSSDGVGLRDAQGRAVQKVEPGLIPIGHGITDVKTVNPTLPSSFDAETFLSQIGAGLDTSLALLTGNFKGTSFSGGKLTIHLLRESTGSIRSTTWLPTQRAIMKRVRAAQQLAGSPFTVNIEFVELPLPDLDPLKSAQAERLRIATNTLSRTETIKARNRDPNLVFQEIKAEQDELTAEVTQLLGTEPAEAQASQESKDE